MKIGIFYIFKNIRSAFLFAQENIGTIQKHKLQDWMNGCIFYAFTKKIWFIAGKGC